MRLLKRQSEPGFTLVELLITLTIAMVLAGLAAPSFNHLIQQIRLTTAVNALFNSIQLTRTEAIKRNGRVDMVANNGNWANGWVIKSADNQQIRIFDPLHSDINVRANSDMARLISFGGTGRARTDANPFMYESGTMTLTIGDSQRRIILNAMGRPRVCDPATAPKNSCDETTKDS